MPFNPSEEADFELVRRARGGDQAAFAELIVRFSPRLYVIAMRLVGSNHAEDLTQDAFTRAYVHLATFREDQAAFGWFRSILVNACRDLWKSKAFSAHTSFEGLEREPEEFIVRDEPESAAISHRTLAAVERAISELPPKYRLPFVLKHLEHLTYEEMEQATGENRNMLKVRVHRARLMLVGKLRGLPEFE